ncbi:MAG: glutamine amidotransferase [Rhodobacteraceae bacterium]|nr:glutamine amidotransferase [Paracoccaceae bacterium]
MHLAILMTNTDESAFARAHPLDGEKFTRFIHLARPGWTVEVHAVKDGQFPAGLEGLDGAMITGSPASVRSGAPWVGQLLALIREMESRRLPMFGACFGHQAIALALGGTVDANPGGWVHGVVPVEITRQPDFSALADRIHLCASHAEQVSALPPGARGFATSPGCAEAGFTLGAHVVTIQHHPEMTPAFLAALTEVMAADLGPDLTARARESLEIAPDQAAFAETVARFFEGAARG